MITKPVFIGVDPTAGGRTHTIAVLDDRLDVLDLKKMSTEDLITFIAGFASGVCGIDAPSGPGSGLMA